MELGGQQTRKKDEYLHTHTDGDARERNPGKEEEGLKMDGKNCTRLGLRH
jgi:hypothetical protein